MTLLLPLALAAAVAAPAPDGAPVALPALKPGLWTSTVAAEGGRPLTLFMCAAESGHSAMFEPWTSFGRDPTCTRRTVAHTAGRTTLATSCLAPGGGQVASKAELSGDLQTSFTYATDDVVTGAPKARNNGEFRSVTTGAWQGPCPPDMVPGRAMMKLPNGAMVQIERQR